MNDYITNDEALRQALLQRAERRRAECPAPTDLESLVMQRIEARGAKERTSSYTSRNAKRFVRLLLPISAAAAIIIAFLLWPANEPKNMVTNNAENLCTEVPITEQPANSLSSKTEPEASATIAQTVAQNRGSTQRQQTQPVSDSGSKIEAPVQDHEPESNLDIAAEMADLQAEMDGLEHQLLSMN